MTWAEWEMVRLLARVNTGYVPLDSVSEFRTADLTACSESNKGVVRTHADVRQQYMHTDNDSVPASCYR